MSGVAIVGIVLVGILFVFSAYRWMAVRGADTTLPVTIGGLVLLGVLFFGRAEISLDSGVLSYRRFVLRRRFPIDLVGGVALRRLSLAWNYYARRPTRIAVVYGKDRRALFSLSAALWSDHDLRSLHKAIGGDSSTDPMTAVELQSEFPGALPGWSVFMEVHPVWAVVIGTLLMFAIIVAILVAWDAVK
ncbi:MAG: hypothetical protein QOI23_1901 [Chloroflexota bacterium]|nr:hypothetical protein [Chloroflexota bacterium]